jgi:hypothetical protein
MLGVPIKKPDAALKRLDSGFRRNDKKRHFPTFYEFFKVQPAGF